MSDGNQANYARIGFFIIAGVALIVGTLVYLGGAGSKKNEFEAETFFSDPVSGLDVGSAVNFRGVRMGSVKRITFVGAEYEDVSREDGRKILVVMALDKTRFRMNDTRSPAKALQDAVTRGLHATVTASGVTGLSRIELNFPKTEVPAERIAWTPHRVTIPPAPSILQNAADAATKILDQLGKMDVLDVWTNVSATVERAGSMMTTLDTLLQSNGGAVGGIVGDLREAAASVREAAAEIRANPSILLRARDAERLPETL